MSLVDTCILLFLGTRNRVGVAATAATKLTCTLVSDVDVDIDMALVRKKV
jgi:hypothetical protein